MSAGSGPRPLPPVRSHAFAGPAGSIEALYRPPPAEPAAPGAGARAALLCHPHPLYGGTMHNRVLFQFEKALAAAGRATLRFNFRGAGASVGMHDDGRGESDDVRSAADELLRLVPGAALDVLGYSFGCLVCWHALGEDPRTRSLTGVGVPLRIADFAFARELRVPLTIVQGEEDEYASGPEVRAFAASLASAPRLFFIEGADHLFTRGYDRLLAVIPEVVAGL